MKYSEEIMHEFKPLGKYKVRLIKPNVGEVLVDIREYVATTGYTGFTKKGVRLNWDNFQLLTQQMEDIERVFAEID